MKLISEMLRPTGSSCSTPEFTSKYAVGVVAGASPAGREKLPGVGLGTFAASSDASSGATSDARAAYIDRDSSRSIVPTGRRWAARTESVPVPCRPGLGRRRKRSQDSRSRATAVPLDEVPGARGDRNPPLSLRELGTASGTSSVRRQPPESSSRHHIRSECPIRSPADAEVNSTAFSTTASFMCRSRGRPAKCRHFSRVAPARQNWPDTAGSRLVFPPVVWCLPGS